MTRSSGKLLAWGAGVFLFAANLLAVLRYALTGFSAQVWNNDYLYISIARMFRDRPWTWNSLQYGGAPLAYLYPPLVPVLMALAPADSLGRAFHLVAAAGYALVPVAVYVLAAQLFRSRGAAFFAAFAYGFLPSPVYWALPEWGHMAAQYHGAPYGFYALVAHSEAAHPIALSAALLGAAAAWRNRWILAGLLCGAAFLINWAGLIGCLMLLAAVGVARIPEQGVRKRVLAALGAAGVAYGLAAFWMTPGFFRATSLFNDVVLRTEQRSEPWTAYTWLTLAGAAAVLGCSLWRRVPRPAAFLLAFSAFAGVAPVAFSAGGAYLVPLPARYVLEFNVALVLCAAYLLNAAGRWRLPVMAVALAAGLYGSSDFLSHAWEMQPRPSDPRQSPAYATSQWLARNAAGSRVLVSGELEGALNIWTGTPQVGGSDQGVSNTLIPAAHREVTFGCNGSPKLAELWLRALAVRYVVYHGAASWERFHSWVRPERFAQLPVAWSGGGDTIYEVPGVTDAAVVDLAEFKRLGELRSTDDEQYLERYVAWAQGKRPARVLWSGPDRAVIEADVRPGDAVLVKLNWDRGWKSAGGTQPDPIGFLLIRARPGTRHALRFGAAWDVWLGRTLTLATLGLLVWMAIRRRAAVWAGCFVLAAGVAGYAALSFHTPPQAPVAEAAYRRLRPPIINAGGIVDTQGNPPPLRRGAPFTIYGLDFGPPERPITVTIGGRPAQILYHEANQLNLVMPVDAPAAAEVYVSVGGCLGNGFTVETE